MTAAEVYPKALWTELEEKAPNYARWAAAVAAHPSITSIYDEKVIIEGAKTRIAKARASA